MVLKVANTQAGGGGSGTVTSVTGNGTVNGITLTGTVTTAGNITLGGTLANITNAQLVNNSATIGNTVVVLGSTVNNIGNLTLANVTILSGSIPNTSVTNGNITIGNTTIGLGNTATNIGNLTLANVNILSGKGNVTNLFNGYTATTAANATTTLTNASTYWQKVTASATNTQTFQLPDATTLPNGAAYVFDNDAGGNVTINDGAAALVDTLVPGSVDFIFLESNATVAGLWGKYSWLPAYVNWGTSTADLGNVSVSNVVISGGQINVTTVNMTANTASNATFTSATMMLTPAGYINYDLNGTLVKIPYYNA